MVSVPCFARHVGQWVCGSLSLPGCAGGFYCRLVGCVGVVKTNILVRVECDVSFLSVGLFEAVTFSVGETRSSNVAAPADVDSLSYPFTLLVFPSLAAWCEYELVVVFGGQAARREKKWLVGCKLSRLVWVRS